jgi:copper homeostasis protein
LILEICTETLSGVRAASMGGAQRIELCSALDFDGLTPSAELVEQARAATDLELLVMVRPVPGPFLADSLTLRTMCAQIQRAEALGADGIVCGCLLPSGRIDLPALEQLVEAAGQLPLTFHRAFDRTPNRIAACEALIDCGVQRILTSGGATTALDGADALRQLVAHSANRIEIVVAGTVRANHIQQLKQRTGAGAFHSALDRNPTPDSVRELSTALQQ